MKEILIINFKRHGDIFQMGKLISSIKSKYPNVNVSLLVNKEFNSSASTLNGVKQVFKLDRKKIISYQKNKIYSNGFALDEFGRTIKELSRNWDLVVNYSNDTISTSLTTYLGGKHSGIKYDRYCNVNYSDEWSVIQNDILTQLKYSPMNFNDTYHRMLGCIENSSFATLNVSNDYNKLCHQNFSKIRQSKDGTNKKIVGIQVFSSTISKMIVRDELIALINLLQENPQTVPALLIAPTNEERAFAARINEETERKSLVIEAEFSALSSVLLNIDMLVTPDTSVKHIADILEVPTIELSLGFSPFLKQGSTNTESIILTPRIRDRVFSEKEFNKNKDHLSNNEIISANDIHDVIKKYYLNEDIKITNDQLSIYRPVYDNLGTYYKNIDGHLDLTVELEREFTREFIAKKTLGKNLSMNTSLFVDLNFSANWIERAQEHLLESSKLVLSTLKPLLNNDLSTLPNKIKEIRSLIRISNDYTKTPFLFFMARFNSLQNPTKESIEPFLMELKSDLQIQFEVIKSYSQLIRDKRRVLRHEGTKEFINECR